MAKDQTKRLTPKKLTANDNSFAALQKISDYAPADQNYKLDNGKSFAAVMKEKREAEVQATAALKAARDETVAAEWNMHNYILGAKDQVRAQYGKSSNELQGLGLKKKTEYKSPVRKKGAARKSA